MSRNRKTLTLLLSTICVVSVTAVAALLNQEHRDGQSKQPHKSREMVRFEATFPVAEYEESEPTDPKEKEKRRDKGKRYDRYKSELAVDTYSDVVTTSSHWAREVPAIPASQSAAVIVGQVLQAQAHLSSNKRRVYSEFVISVEDILKNNGGDPIEPGRSITADRLGGRVKHPNGKVGLYWVSGQSMPRIGGRYLLFLTQTDQEQDFTILTGYELRDGHVYLLDNPGSGHPITSYQGADETSLLRDVRAAITNQL